MAQATDSEQPTSPPGGNAARIDDATPHEVLPSAWPLFTAVWLLFPVGFVIQVLRTTSLSPLQLLTLFTSLAAFLAVFLWLMLRYPFPAARLTARELRVRVGLLLALAILALYLELAYGNGVPYRFMYVVVAAAVTLPTRKAAWAVAVTAVVAGVVYEVAAGGDTLATTWRSIVPFPLIGIGMIAVSRLVVTVRELQAARREIAQLAAAEAVAEERLRFARDLHDLLGHSLSLIVLKSTLAGRLMPPGPEAERAAREAQDIEEVARQALGEVRDAVAGYRRPTLEGELAGAREVLEAAGIDCHIEGDIGVVPEAMEAVLAWSVREGATNVVRHSRAERCEIRLTSDEEEVRVEVDDDGRGPSPAEASGGTGLAGLAERVAASGGGFEAASLPAGGFRLRVSLPLRNGTPSTFEPASGITGS